MSENQEQETFEGDYGEVYVAPDVELTEEELEMCSRLADYFYQYAVEMKMKVVEQSKQMHPEILTASSLGHLSALAPTLVYLRDILQESLEDTSEVSDALLQLSATIAAHKSICEQMYQVYLNVFDIMNVALNEKNATPVVEAAERLVAEATAANEEHQASDN